MSHVHLSCKTVTGQRFCEEADCVLCPENRTAFENIPVNMNICTSQGTNEERFSDRAKRYSPELRVNLDNVR
jgi:hypothetical protein